MKKVLVLVTAGLCFSSVLFLLYRKYERSFNRPLVETLIWNLQQPIEDKLSHENLEALIRIMLLNYLASDYIHKLKSEYVDRISMIIRKESTTDNVSLIVDKILQDVSSIRKDNARFVSLSGECRLLVPFGSPKIVRDYSGRECALFLDQLKNDFLVHLGLYEKTTK